MDKITENSFPCRRARSSFLCFNGGMKGKKLGKREAEREEEGKCDSFWDQEKQ